MNWVTGKYVVMVALFVATATVSPEGSAKEIELPPEQHIIFGLDGFFSVLTDVPHLSNAAVGWGWSGRAGWRYKEFGVFLHIARGYWLAVEYGADLKQGVFNLGAGVEYLLFKERLRMSLAAGTSTMLFDAAFDKAGSVGFFVEYKPASLRWKLSDWLLFELTPVGISYQMPVVPDPSIQRLEYRTMVGFEVSI